ncbi:voltage-gated potassium channel [Tessaracoccus bendigoensis DSM 12906]|uniref:Voltage-gated potassium channel n=1 Tax=Tessaracoccus bendigoensis DSM 12906 TaxID=1123357 RepID=A0A1M6CKB9_9ACTN|nr:potassium channel family protein [Tessaracoccus bendigoensis]SHI61447.1 voltage-gated potassium channel [Tessaracoccus bendigoensis DSM 12906]
MEKLQKGATVGGILSTVSLPRLAVSPFRELARRGLLALGLLLATTLLVWFDRGSYVDNVGQDGVSFVDALYYATVTVTTTGYGDITPLSQHARLLSALVITPLRIAFLVVLVGTTIEVLANQGSRAIKDSIWRKKLRNHVIVIGYGAKGRSAVNTLRRQGEKPDRIVVIDENPTAVSEANYDGYAAFQGDATRRSLLRRAEVSKARQVIISLDRDDASILTTLTVRQLNPTAGVIVSVREQENVPLVRQSGASAVVTSSETVGRLLGLSAVGPELGTIMQDMLTGAEGLEVHQRLATADEVGQPPSAVTGERVIGIIRNGTLRRFYDKTATRVEIGDELIVVRRAQPPSPRDKDVLRWRDD